MSKVCKDRVVIVTGAGGGLGRQYATAFAAEGAKVVVNDINQAAADETVALIKQAGGQAIANTSNITSYADSAHAVKQAIDTFGDLHVVVKVQIPTELSAKQKQLLEEFEEELK